MIHIIMDGGAQLLLWRLEKEQAIPAVFVEGRGNHTESTAHWDPPEESKIMETQTDSAAVGRSGEPPPEPEK
jgi:hypothetical protein